MNSGYAMGRFRSGMAVFIIGALVLSGLAISGCAPKDASDKAVRETVGEYNAALVMAYRDREIKYLEPYAAKDQIHQLIPVIMGFKDRGERLMLALDEFKIDSANVKADKAVVKSTEKWTYWTENASTTKPVSEKKTESYSMTYMLTLKDGKWRIEQLDKN